MNLFGKGSYLLVFRLPETSIIFRGEEARLGPGVCFYAGSAFGSGGLKSRIGRHIRSEKKVHWHIDLITERFRPVMILVNEGEKSFEHDYIKYLSECKDAVFPLRNFGNGDCNVCPSHLVCFSNLPKSLIPELVLRFSGMKIYESYAEGLYSELNLNALNDKLQDPPNYLNQ